MASTAFALDGQDELRMDCELAEAMGDCGLAEGLSETHSPVMSSSYDDSDPTAHPSVADSLTASPPVAQRPRYWWREPPPHGSCSADRGAVADIVDRIFQNVYSKIEATEVLIGLGQLRVVHASARQGRTSQGAVRKERRLPAKPHLPAARTAMAREVDVLHAEATRPSVESSAALPYTL